MVVPHVLKVRSGCIFKGQVTRKNDEVLAFGWRVQRSVEMSGPLAQPQVYLANSIVLGKGGLKIDHGYQELYEVVKLERRGRLV